MALPKKVKTGGVFYRGAKLDVATTAGDYALAIVPTGNDFACNGFSVTPKNWGEDDSFSLLHIKGTTGASGGVIADTFAEGVYFIGAGVSINLDFATLQLIKPGDSLRFIYHGSAGVATPVYTTVEVIK